MGNNIIQISENWYSLDGFKYKLMKYKMSCFPCSLHIAYANLGRIDASGSEIEDDWNILNNGCLTQVGLTPAQILDCLKTTKYKLGEYSLFTPEDFDSNADINRIVSMISNTFISDPMSDGRPSAMIIATTNTASVHAQIIFRTDDNRFFYYYPSSDATGKDYCYEIKFIGINASKDGNGRNQVEIFYSIKNGKEQYAIMANCVVLIN